MAMSKAGKILACNKCADVARDQLIEDVLKTQDGSLLAHSCGGRFAIMTKARAFSISDARLSPKAFRADQFRRFLKSNLADYSRESEALRTALHRYGNHNTDCASRYNSGAICDCGLAEAEKL